MSAHTIGVAIAITPFALACLALIVWGSSTSDGRWSALLVFGATTATMVPVTVGLAVAGSPAWLVCAVTMLALDALVAVAAGVGWARENLRHE